MLVLVNYVGTCTGYDKIVQHFILMRSVNTICIEFCNLCIFILPIYFLNFHFAVSSVDNKINK